MFNFNTVYIRAKIKETANCSGMLAVNKTFKFETLEEARLKRQITACCINTIELNGKCCKLS